MISILYHIITKTAIPLYQNCGFYLAEQSRFELYSLAVQVRLASLGLRPYACRCQATAGATLLASLMSELIDSASLRYLRLGREATPGAESCKSRLRKTKRDTRKRYLFLFGGAGEI